MSPPDDAPDAGAWPLPLVLAGLVGLVLVGLVVFVGVLLLVTPSSLRSPPLGSGSGLSSPFPSAPPTGAEGNGIAVEPIADGLERPVGMALTNGPDGGIFVAQQAGEVVYVEGGEVQGEPVLDLSDVVLAGGEQGMLGVALHPEFANNGRFYIAYTHIERETILAEYTAPDGRAADPASERVLLRLPQESDFHKGGAMVFHPESGLLYVSIGDDAWPRGTTPDYTDSLRGTIIRIDVDERTGDLPYGIPDGNAFTDGSGPPEVFDYGLRNPWRMSIDAATGDLYVADVGSERYEEVSRHRADVPAGLDFGWGAWEGFECRRHQIREELDCDEWADAEPPILVIEGGEFQSGDCAIIGGYVYHGTDVPALDGLYVFSDYCSGRIRTVPTDQDKPTPTIVLDTEIRPSSFAVDSSGELYMLDVDSGVIYRITGS